MKKLLPLSFLSMLALSLGGCAGDDSPKCRGVALSCSSLSEYQCDNAAGCYENGSCQGVVASCSSHYGAATCNSQLNCYWSYTTDAFLTATYTSCSSWSTQSYCESYDGCYYVPECEGLKYECDELDDSFSCGSQPGCTWE